MGEMIAFSQIEQILEILDDEEINRELIEIPLGTRDPGGIERLPSGKVRVTVPTTSDFDQWLTHITPALLAAFGVEP